MTTVYVVRRTAVNCVAELRSAYTLRTWVLGWLVRMIAQVTFFALVGRMVGTAGAVRYLAVGNAVVLACLESVIVVLSLNDEREQRTLPLLAVSPAGHVPVLLARGMHWIVTGMASSSIALVTVPVLLGVPERPGALLSCLPILWLISLTSYCYGCGLSSIVLRLPRLDWIVLNVGYLVVMTLGGVDVPIGFWPGWLSWLAQVLPVTHGLAAIRAVLDGHGVALPEVALEVAVGAGWFVAACLGHRRFIEAGRMKGNIEFG
jgi:ABC-2 type transport system permease protein